jgi:hypothetical protein
VTAGADPTGDAATAIRDGRHVRLRAWVAGDAQNEQTRPVGVQLLDAHHERWRCQLTDAITQPAGVQRGAAKGVRAAALVVESDDQRTALMVGQAGGGVRQQARRSLVPRGARLILSVGRATTRVLLAVERLGLDVGGAGTRQHACDRGASGVSRAMPAAENHVGHEEKLIMASFAWQE